MCVVDGPAPMISDTVDRKNVICEDSRQMVPKVPRKSGQICLIWRPQGLLFRCAFGSVCPYPGLCHWRHCDLKVCVEMTISEYIHDDQAAAAQC